MGRLQDLRVGQRLTAAFGVIALLLVAVVVVALAGHSSQLDTNERSSTSRAPCRMRCR